MAREVTDNETYIRLVHLIENRDNINEEMLEAYSDGSHTINNK